MTDTSTGENVSGRSQALATVLGEPNVEVVDWRSLMQEGVIVEVKVSRWRPRAKLELDDLGLPAMSAQEQASVDQLMRLGSKRLLPDQIYKELDSAERQVYRSLQTYALKTRWGMFVPVTAYEAWKGAHAEAVAELERVRDELITQYDAILAELLAQYRVAAERAYRILSRIDGRVATNQTDFINSFLNRIRALVPSAEEIGASFQVDVTLNVIPLPSQLDNAEALTEQLSVASDTAVIERDALAERRRLLEEMNRDIVRTAQQQKQQLVEGFLSDLISQVRGLAYEAASDVLAVVQEKGQLHPRSIARLKNLVKQVRQLNFFGDRDLNTMMDQVRAVLDQPAKDRSLDEITAVLQGIIQQTRTTLLDLGAEVRAERIEASDALDLDLPDTEMRSGREEALLEPLDVTEMLREERETD